LGVCWFINPSVKKEITMATKTRKKLLTYLIVAIGIFLLILFVGIFFIDLKWSESALLSVFLTVIGVGTYWWREDF
jgi:hypothetical protein